MAAVQTSKTPANSDRKKLYALGALLGVLAIMGGYNFLSSGSSTPAPPPAAAPRDPNRVPNSAVANRAPGDDAPASAVADGVGGLLAPLDLGQLTPAALGATAQRNPFGYPPPPIVKPPRDTTPIPTPPTIQIGQVLPGSVVAGIPRGIDVTVTGNLFPADAQVLWNNRSLPTQRLSADQLRVSLSAADIASPGSVQVKVVSASQPTQLWSDVRPFQLIASPTPTFKYVGRIGDRAIIDFGNDRDGQKLVRVGDTIGVPAQWRVVAIQAERVDLLDIRNEIPKSIALAKAN